LVLDADVVSSATDRKGLDPVPERCAAVLEHILDVCHRVVLAGDITEEWHDHQSWYFRTWLSQMFARRKHERPTVEPDEGLRAKILATAGAEQEEEALTKDLRLIEAALAADGIIVSRDDAARRLFVRASRRVGEIRRLVWVNPATDPVEALLPWLEAGAPPVREWQLGFQLKSEPRRGRR
jgi:hypothetical protein